MEYDSKMINIFIHKKKYQLPNIQLLLDKFAQTMKSKDKKKNIIPTGSGHKKKYAISAS